MGVMLAHPPPLNPLPPGEGKLVFSASWCLCARVRKNSCKKFGYPDIIAAMKLLTDQIKALGDETRLRILNLLRGQELCVCDIFAALDLPQSTVSRHLAILRRAGWVNDERRGSWMYYRLADDAAASAMLEPLLTRMDGCERARDDLQALGVYLERKNGAACL